MTIETVRQSETFAATGIYQERTVLLRTDDTSSYRYMVHTKASDGGLYKGLYTSSRKDADKEFNRRVYDMLGDVMAAHEVIKYAD